MSGIALQLYTMRDPAKQDLAGMLKRVREMGWEYVQWSGMPAMPGHRIRAELDAAGLKAIACHTGVEPFEADFPTEMLSWNIVGVKYCGPGGMMGDCKDTLEAWVRGAKRMNAVGAKLRGCGVSLTYHNHASEFEKFDGDPRCKLDILMDETDPANLMAELDLAWVQVAGVNPADYLRKYARRCPSIHIKDLAKDKKNDKVYFTPLGQGALDWPEVLKAAKEAEVQWYIYEQDTCEDPFADAKASYEFLKSNGL